MGLPGNDTAQNVAAGVDFGIDLGAGLGLARPQAIAPMLGKFGQPLGAAKRAGSPFTPLANGSLRGAGAIGLGAGAYDKQARRKPVQPSNCAR